MITPLLYGTGAGVRTIGLFIGLVPEGSVVTETMMCRGSGFSCQGSGSLTYSDEGQGKCSGIWLKTVDFDSSGQYGFDIPRGGMYSFCLDLPHDRSYEVTYRNPEGSSTASSAGWWRTASTGSPIS